jgi:anthranilate synthase/aminodeoxychorismate synthase-like glutamine amidotransferase
MTKILLIDNYDSFVYNIAQYLGELGAETTVVRNDAPDIDRLVRESDGFVISPGPGHPKDSGHSLDLISKDGHGKPVLGVCLGHQAIAYAHGGKIERAKAVVHGKVSDIHHSGDELFDGVPADFKATRYHSLIVNRNIPDTISILAESNAGEIMALRVKGKQIYGVQFHPESVMTSHGKRILSNFLRMCGP